jgi:hypothetical protein
VSSGLSSSGTPHFGGFFLRAIKSSLLPVRAAKADNPPRRRAPREHNHHEQLIHDAISGESLFSIIEAQIPSDRRRAPVKARDLGKVEPVLDEIALPLRFVPFELPGLNVARLIRASIFYVLQQRKARA